MDIFFPLKFLADYSVFNLLRLDRQSHLAEALAYFIYDWLKIMILLAVIIFVISLVRTFLPPEKIRRILFRKNNFFGHILASLFGVITPFCTCSAIPLFLGFVQAGIPLGVTFSFLVSSPMVNEVALVMLFGLFGWKIALLYALSGLLIAIFTGLIIGRLKPEGLLADYVLKTKISAEYSGKKMTGRDRCNYAKEYTFDIVKKVWPYIALGVGLGSLIHGFVPADFLARYAGADKWFGVPLAVLVGIPLYANAAGVIPLVSALTEKGVALGTVLAFMMAVVGLSLPEFLILKKVMKVKLILIFAGIVGAGIVFTGYLFNLVLG